MCLDLQVQSSGIRKCSPPRTIKIRVLVRRWKTAELAQELCDIKAKKNPLSLLDREPPLLDEDSNVWHRPRWERGDLAEARLFAFLRGSIWYGSMSVSKFAQAERR